MDFHRVFDILPYQLARFPQKTALSSRENGVWKSLSTLETLAEIDRLSAGLLTDGFKIGDRVGILAHASSPRWVIADLALQQIGCTPVPIHATSRPDEIQFIFEDAALRGCFISNQKMLEKLHEAAVFPEKIWAFEPTDGTTAWENLACEPSDFELETIQKRRSAIGERDLATIIYTSGTTGQPKGVLLSHLNLVSNIKATLAISPLAAGHVVASFLPMSHVFERMISQAAMAAGCNLYFFDNQSLTLAELRKIRPHFFTAVPRFLEKMHAIIVGQKEKLNPLFSQILSWAVALGERYPSRGVEAMAPDFHLKLWLADWLVFRRWRRSLGGRVEGIIVGGAALQPKLARLFSAAGVPIRVGYGLTESSPVVAFNRFEPGGNLFGTVGIAVPGVEIRIAEPTAEMGLDGEIEVRGPNVFQGYLNRPDESAAHFTVDGWLRTGDLGHFVHRRFLKITGRRRDVFKTSTGKFVAPEFVENQFISSPFVENCMVVGLNRPFVVALILPDFEVLKNWCLEKKIHWTAPQFMVINPKVERLFQQILEETNERLASSERVRAVRLVFEDWSSETGELTPTLKLRRAVLLTKFSKLIEEMYTAAAP